MLQITRLKKTKLKAAQERRTPKPRRNVGIHFANCVLECRGVPVFFDSPIT
jgi:hypothetical protein